MFALEASVAALASLSDNHARLVFGEPCEVGWLQLESLGHGGLEALLADVAPLCGSARDYLGVSVARMLTDGLLIAGWPMVMLHRRLPDLSAGNLSGQRSTAEPRFARIAIHRPQAWVLPDDPASGDPAATVVSDVPALHELFATQIVELLAPQFAAVRAVAPFGLTGMWAQVADRLHGLAMTTARASGRSQEAAWDEATAVADLVERHAAVRLPRPRRFPVVAAGRCDVFQVRASCCLRYKAPVLGGDDGDKLCTSCPLRSDDDRTARLVTWIEARSSG